MITIEQIAKTVGEKPENLKYAFAMAERNKEIINECSENAQQGAYDSHLHYLDDLMMKARQDAMKVIVEAVKNREKELKSFKKKIMQKMTEFDEMEHMEKDFYPKLGKFVFELASK